MSISVLVDTYNIHGGMLNRNQVISQLDMAIIFVNPILPDLTSIVCKKQKLEKMY
jgi:hypothetical protein